MQTLYPFGPGVDSQSDNPFMPISPEVAAENGVHVPLLIGYNNAEGIMTLKSSVSKKQFSKIVSRQLF